MKNIKNVIEMALINDTQDQVKIREVVTASIFPSDFMSNNSTVTCILLCLRRAQATVFVTKSRMASLST